MKIISLLLVTLTWSCAYVVGLNAARNPTSERRAENTCADTSITVTYFQAFSPSRIAHAVNTRVAFSAVNTLGDDWQFQGDAFLAWTDPQNFTVPLYRFFAQSGQDFLYTTSTDSNPPSVPGFALQTIVAYVYQTQVCGSVPLLGVWNKAAGDHFYTTSQAERDLFLKRDTGWVDVGIAGYVLRTNSDCTCSA